MLPQKSPRSCWTCKDRKIACDKHLPICFNCIKSSKLCLGYGIRLSWPRKGDCKRAMVSKDSLGLRAPSPGWSRAEFVNVFVADIEISLGVIESGIIQRVAPLPRLRANPRWTPAPFIGAEADLFVFYQSRVVQLLTSANNSSVQNLVVRMSFTDSSPASSAILYSIYAISSFYLSRVPQAFQYRDKAIIALGASTAQHHATKDVLQRIIAVNYLALMDSMHSPNATCNWAASICYAKTTAIEMFSTDQSYQGDLAVILDWVYYYDVISKFSVRHYERRAWQTLICAKKNALSLAEMNSPDTTSIVPTLGCSLEVLSSISSLIDTVLEMDTEDHPRTEMFDKLERRLKYATQHARIEDLEDPHSTVTIQEMVNTAELYRLAGLIYLHRGGRRTPISNQALQRYIADAFELLDSVEMCERTMPLFVIACEARADIQRATILRIINATQLRSAPAHMIRVRGFIERYWAQEDLDIGQEIGYATKVTAVLSTSDGLPAFS